MDIRIGAKSPVYGSRPTSRVTDSSLKTSFAMMMVKERSISQGSATSSKSPAAKTGSINQDTVTISGNDLTQRLESVHQKIDEMDFTEKNIYKMYKSIYDAYEAEFGFLDMLFYLDEETYNIIYKDREAVFANKIPCYSSSDIRFHRYAMGYDKMSKEEIIASIKERVGGNSYVHKICEINELKRAGVLTPAQGHNLYLS